MRTTITMPTVINTANDLPTSQIIQQNSNSFLSKKQIGFNIQQEEMSKLFPASSHKINISPIVFDPSININDIFKYVK